MFTQLKKILLNKLSNFMKHTMNFNFMETTGCLFKSTQKAVIKTI